MGFTDLLGIEVEVLFFSILRLFMTEVALLIILLLIILLLISATEPAPS